MLLRANLTFLSWGGAFFFQGLDFSLSLTLPYPLGTPSPFLPFGQWLLVRGGFFLEGDTCKGPSRGLLKRRLNPKPVVASVAAHVDGTTVEVQAVRVASVPWVSTWRPIEAKVANEVQLTRVVVTQGGQLEVITCVGCGKESLRYRPAVSVAICSPISAVVGCVWVVFAYICFLLKPHATFI